MCENGFVLSSGKIVAMSIYFFFVCNMSAAYHWDQGAVIWEWLLSPCEVAFASLSLFPWCLASYTMSLTRLRLWAVQRWMTYCQIACAVLSVQECYCCACHWAGIQWLWKVVPRSSCQLCHAAKRNVPRLIIRPLSRAHPPSRWMQEIFSILLYLCSWLKNII